MFRFLSSILIIPCAIFALPVCRPTWIAEAAVRQVSRLPVYGDLDQTVHGESISISSNSSLIAAEHDEELLVVDRKTGRLVANLGQGIKPKWSPTEDRLAFYSTRNGSLQIWTWKHGQSQPQPLTQIENGIDPDPYTRFDGSWPTDALALAWSPDGRRIAFVSRVRESSLAQPPDAVLVVDNRSPADEALRGIYGVPMVGSELHVNGDWGGYTVTSFDGAMHISQVFVVDVMSDRLEQVTTGESEIYDPIWNESGEALFAASASLATGYDSISDISLGKEPVRLIRIDYKSREQIVLVKDAGIPRRLALSSNRRYLAFATASKFFYPPHIEVLDLSMTGNAPNKVPNSDANDVDNFDWQTRANDLIIRLPANNGYGLFRLDPRSGARSLIAMRPGSVWGPASAWEESADGNFAWINEDGLVWVSGDGRNEHKLRDYRPRTQSSLSLSPVETLNWRNRSGDALTGWYLLPPGYRVGNKYPLLVDAYPLIGGGGHWMDTPLNGNQVWAAQGYVVFRPSPRAPHTWMNSKVQNSFYAAAKGAAGWKVSLDDVMSGVDELIRRGIVDSDRMCITGHSNGGGVTAYVITQTDRFKCAVIIAPTGVDWVTGALEVPGIRKNIGDASGGFDFNTNPDEFVGMSPVFQLYKSKTPTLVAAGDDDGGFLKSAIEVFVGLRDAGTDVTLLRYPHQGHVFKGAAMRDFFDREMAFFRQHLGPLDVNKTANGDRYDVGNELRGCRRTYLCRRGASVDGLSCSALDASAK